MANDQSDLAQRLAQVEQQLEQLQARFASLDGGGTSVKSPFVVIDEQGNKLLEVIRKPHDISLRVFNSEGKIAASIGADGTRCGYLAIRNADERLVGYLSVENWGGRLIIQDNNEDGGVTLNGGDCDNEGGTLLVCSTGGRNGSILDIWSVPNGGGIEITNAVGEQVAAWPRKSRRPKPLPNRI